MAFKILVVEDTELLRRMYTDRLAADGFEVLQAGDGLEALSVLRHALPDLILLDLVMPKMSGLEVIEIVKKDPRLKDVPVLILSNLGQDSDIQRGVEMGAIDYLIKNDARPADVSAKISSILNVTGSRALDSNGYRLLIRDREADADRFVADAKLVRRFWCPACEVELALELIPDPHKPGWYSAHMQCPSCEREY